MKYFEPTSTEEALSLLASEDGARCLAGGQSLVASMNLGFADIEALIALRGIAELNGVQVDADGISIGAMTTHATVAGATELTGRFGALREAAAKIAHGAIRSQGTIGGSICHADPAADYPAVLVALDAEVAAASARGRRTVPARDFFVNFLTTALEPDELVTGVRFARPADNGTWSGVYEKFARTHGDFATVSVACALSLSGGVCRGAAIALGACDVRPVRSAEAEACLVGSDLREAAVAAAGRVLAEAADPPSDVRGSADYRRRLIPGLVARAIARARAGVEAL